MFSNDCPAIIKNRHEINNLLDFNEKFDLNVFENRYKFLKRDIDNRDELIRENYKQISNYRNPNCSKIEKTLLKVLDKSILVEPPKQLESPKPVEPEQQECIVCMDAISNMICIPCNHMVVCRICYIKLGKPAQEKCLYCVSVVTKVVEKL
jgi:regulator of replication initiation timing